MVKVNVTLETDTWNVRVYFFSTTTKHVKFLLSAEQNRKEKQKKKLIESFDIIKFI